MLFKHRKTFKIRAYNNCFKVHTIIAFYFGTQTQKLSDVVAQDSKGESR